MKSQKPSEKQAPEKLYRPDLRERIAGTKRGLEAVPGSKPLLTWHFSIRIAGMRRAASKVQPKNAQHQKQTLHEKRMRNDQ
jgi:hypothetical protein